MTGNMHSHFIHKKRHIFSAFPFFRCIERKEKRKVVPCSALLSERAINVIMAGPHERHLLYERINKVLMLHLRWQLPYLAC
jgi:hypothetical protein